jgi:quinol monooxygenase YgiN
MWTQIIKTRLKPGKDTELTALIDALRAAEQPNSGLIRSTATRDQKDPSTLYMIVTFESEEKARARENDPRRQEGLQKARAIMAEIFEGAPEFIDLNVVAEHSGL